MIHAGAGISALTGLYIPDHSGDAVACRDNSLVQQPDIGSCKIVDFEQIATYVQVTAVSGITTKSHCLWRAASMALHILAVFPFKLL
jgi:hypothetical protein